MLHSWQSQWVSLVTAQLRNLRLTWWLRHHGAFSPQEWHPPLHWHFKGTLSQSLQCSQWNLSFQIPIKVNLWYVLACLDSFICIEFRKSNLAFVNVLSLAVASYSFFQFSLIGIHLSISLWKQWSSRLLFWVWKVSQNHHQQSSHDSRCIRNASPSAWQVTAGDGTENFAAESGGWKCSGWCISEPSTRRSVGECLRVASGRI